MHYRNQPCLYLINIRIVYLALIFCVVPLSRIKFNPSLPQILIFRPGRHYVSWKAVLPAGIDSFGSFQNE